jgi:hypothetical protein
MSSKVFRDVRTEVVYNAETLDTSVNSDPINVQNYRDIEMYLVTTNSGGTSPTLDISLETKAADGTWIAISPAIAFTQVVGDTTEYINSMLATYGVPIPLGQWIRFACVITGTSPTFDVTLSYILKS